METLREELQIVVDKKSELERRLQTALNERETMASQLEEANDRIMLLERHVREQVIVITKEIKTQTTEHESSITLPISGNEIRKIFDRHGAVAARKHNFVRTFGSWSWHIGKQWNEKVTPG